MECSIRMPTIIFKPEPCPKCGKNQFLADKKLGMRPKLPRVPLSGPDRKKIRKQCREIVKKWRKENDRMKKEAICAICLVPGGTELVNLNA